MIEPARLPQGTAQPSFVGRNLLGADQRCRLCSKGRTEARIAAARPPLFKPAVSLQVAAEGCTTGGALVPGVAKADAGEPYDPLSEVLAQAAMRRQAAVVRLVSRGPPRQDCVVCYEQTGDGTLCCGQPLCCGCAASVSPNCCPVCRQPLQHRGAGRSRLQGIGLTPGSRQVPRILRHDRTSAPSSSPPGTSVSIAFGDYVDDVAQQAESLRAQTITGEDSRSAEEQLRELQKAVAFEIDRRLADRDAFRLGPTVDSRHVEKLRRYGLLAPRQLSKLMAFSDDF
eukprot:TRINITY_DN26345_c0_g1_i2.p1 TRINITY_DN26345_c0_g1~~TRINITY_DN26345_c0_g1_i2.p1  ORF type:complete len:284 (-),score=26.38 TRINITY_DN26345_c0_g1_i2:181-1032(-)